jgi:hypothetical protein
MAKQTTKHGFRCIYDDSTALYVRQVEPRRFHYLEVIDMNDACGQDNEGHPRYVGSLSEVDLDQVSPEQLREALKSCGWDGMPETDEANAEACNSYGNRAPLHGVSTDSRDKAFRECRKESYRLDDSEAYAEALDRPVNAIGSTAREYARGDLNSALTRGLLANNPNARIMTKMYGVDPDEARLRLLNSDDRLAFVMGYMNGEAGRAKPDVSEGDELAEAYVAAYAFGLRVHAGEITRPEWIGIK